MNKTAAFALFGLVVLAFTLTFWALVFKPGRPYHPEGTRYVVYETATGCTHYIPWQGDPAEDCPHE